MEQFGKKLFLKSDSRSKGNPSAWRALATELHSYSGHTCDWETLRERLWLGSKKQHSLIQKYTPSFRAKHATSADSGSTDDRSEEEMAVHSLIMALDDAEERNGKKAEKASQKEKRKATEAEEVEEALKRGGRSKPPPSSSRKKKRKQSSPSTGSSSTAGGGSSVRGRGGKKVVVPKEVKQAIEVLLAFEAKHREERPADQSFDSDVDADCYFNIPAGWAMKKDPTHSHGWNGIVHMMPHDEGYYGWVDDAGTVEDVAAYDTYHSWIQEQDPNTAAAMARSWGGDRGAAGRDGHDRDQDPPADPFDSTADAIKATADANVERARLNNEARLERQAERLKASGDARKERNAHQLQMQKQMADQQMQLLRMVMQQAGGSAAAASSSGGSGGGSSGGSDVMGRLERLIEMKEAGHLTADEFASAKAKLLNA